MEDFKECRLFSEYRLLYTSTEEYPNSMRYMIKLKENINLPSLTFAINMVQKRYPYFCVELKKDENGFYFIKNDRNIILENINKNILLNSEESNYHFISFQYSDDNYIIFNVSHALTDGNGTYALIRTLLYYYITNAYNIELSKENIRLVGDEITEEELNDPLLKLKNLNRPTQSNNSTSCLNIIKENNLENQSKVVYHLSIDEKEFMEYAKSIKASPATLIVILLSKAIKKENANSTQPIRINLALDLRKILNTPLAHQSLASGISFEYDDKLTNLNIEDQIKALRTKVKESLQEPKSLDFLSMSYFIQMMFLNEKDMNKIKQISAMFNSKSKEAFCGNVSYVGKANFGDAEKYITDFKAYASTHIPIMIMISAVNGKFYLDFMQNFEDERYFKAFKEELENIKIKYEFNDLNKLELPKMKLII